MALTDIPRTIWWEDDKVMLVDQTRLPLQGDILVCDTYDGVCVAIQTLAVRGAPALGVAAALALAVWTKNQTEGIENVDDYLYALDEVANAVGTARPTAVNLIWGAQRIRRVATDNADLPLDELKELVIQEALNMQAEDEERNRKIGELGAELFAEGSQYKVLTHCNAGSLATAYFGTALGVIFTAHEQGKIEHVWVDETRPVNQGGRLTAWELGMAGVPSALITDSMAAAVMQQGWVDAVIVGADHICANGDTANKIGTYGLAVLAKAHDIPFYVAAPTSTVDLMLSSGDQIEIEQRDPREVVGFTVSGVFEPDSETASKAFDALTEEGPWEVPLKRGHQMLISRKGGAYTFDAWFQMAPQGVQVFNPAFDVTPAEYITAFITERGVVWPQPDFETALAITCMSSGGMHDLTVEGFRQLDQTEFGVRDDLGGGLTPQHDWDVEVPSAEPAEAESTPESTEEPAEDSDAEGR
ncbi:MAG: S-methyl-5-thioribose-1-phosphate isomerase [Coriobacteriales bacterium]|nr:S-methyl-5-thioribose-1-phosphate isomerase [Coriobacteriales bacterium]